MRFTMFIKIQGQDDSTAWPEHEDRPHLTTREQVELWSRECVARFNDTLRPHEQPRSLVRVEVTDEPTQELRDDASAGDAGRNLLEQMLDRDLSSSAETAGQIAEDHSREAAEVLARDLIVSLETEMLLLNQIAAEKAQARDNVLRDVQERLDAIEAEYTPRIEAQQAEINRLEPLIKTNVMAARKTIKGETLIDCQYIKESHSWDTKLIDGFALAYPALESARIKKAATTRFVPKQSRSKKASDQ